MQMTLKAARMNRNMSQLQASKELGVNINTLSNWENGKSVPSVIHALKCCKLYGCSMDDLFFEH